MTGPHPDRSDAVLLDALLGPLAEALREVGLPLHILLESRFGELNENQAEMIEAARRSAADADVILRRALRVRALESQPRVRREESTRPIDLFRGALAIASAQAADRGVRFEPDLSPALPRIVGDRAHFEEALTVLLTDAARLATDGRAVPITVDERDAKELVVEVDFGGATPPVALDRLIGWRLIEAEGGHVSYEAGRMRLHLPRAGPPT